MLSLFFPQASPRHLRQCLARWLLLSVDPPHSAGEAGGRNAGTPHSPNLAVEPHTNKHIGARCVKQRNCLLGDLQSGQHWPLWRDLSCWRQFLLKWSQLGYEGENVWSNLFTVGILACTFQYYLRKFWDKMTFTFFHIHECACIQMHTNKAWSYYGGPESTNALQKKTYSENIYCMQHSKHIQHNQIQYKLKKINYFRKQSFQGTPSMPRHTSCYNGCDSCSY